MKKIDNKIFKNNKIHVFITTFRKSTRNFAKQFSRDVESLYFIKRDKFPVRRDV